MASVSSSINTHFSERSEYNELKDITTEMNRKLMNMSKTIDDMQISINEKEAEIIRLNLCLGDEKRRSNDLHFASNK